ncbi:hypothetical protein KM043_005944 [Ampulex compressa]|nr:hypothetical protein KM043_005944 [Ampulex compressa]
MHSRLEESDVLVEPAAFGRPNEELTYVGVEEGALCNEGVSSGCLETEDEASVRATARSFTTSLSEEWR